MRRHPYDCIVRPRLVVDENIPLAREAFGGLGDVELLPGRRIDAAAVARADALIVRSVTRVDERLLAASPVRFVATATIGTDHVDLAYLERRGAAFAHAPGCNARSVAEYVTAALLELEHDRMRDFAGATIGVVGAGNVGSRVSALASALGMRVLVCDPPRAEAEGPEAFHALDTLLDEADVLTLHVPLTRDGRHATRHLVGAAEIARLRPGAVLINTSRGGVVDDQALHRACASGRVAAVLDVWEGEPEPALALIEVVRLATPHVAGYSLDGKLAGTRMVAEAAYRFFGVVAPDPRLFEVANPDPTIHVTGHGRAALRQAVARAYAIADDDARMRAALAAATARGEAFD
ncbi:MAG: 4-phosphoerythronate dehydrogenase, partial [Thermodesulfobacteriota bacterium]